MVKIVMDLVITIFQTLLIIYAINYCIEKQFKKSLLNLGLMSALLIIINFSILNLCNNKSVYVLLVHILDLCIITALYMKNKLSTILSYTIAYFFIEISLFCELFVELLQGIIITEYVNVINKFLIYVIQFIIAILGFIYIKKIKAIYKVIIREKQFVIITLISSFIMDLIIMIFINKYIKENMLIKNIESIILCIVLIGIIIYFTRIQQKSDKIVELNKALENKNNELRKIKHDYGAQISYLYGLHLMDRVDDLGKALKNIIDNDEATPSAVEISKNENSILSRALKPAIDKGIHAIVEEKCDLELMNINKLDLYNVIREITESVIDSMNEEGRIIAKAYDKLGSIEIKLQYSNQELKDEYINDIFNLGFTTTNNSYICNQGKINDIKKKLEDCGWKIYVKSTNQFVEFRISHIHQNNESAC